MDDDKFNRDALLTQMSIPQNIGCAKTQRQLHRHANIKYEGERPPPRRLISAAAVWIVPSVWDAVRPFYGDNEFAPSRAAAAAIARPMPRLPPVMNSVRPRALSYCLLELVDGHCRSYVGHRCHEIQP